MPTSYRLDNWRSIAAAISSLEIRLAATPHVAAALIEEFVRANVKPGATLLSNSYLNFSGL
jgi:hypothetical protein